MEETSQFWQILGKVAIENALKNTIEKLSKTLILSITTMKILLTRSLIIVIISLFVFSACSSDCDEGSSCDDGNPDTYNDAFDDDCQCTGNLNVFTDTRDGQMYNTIKIGSQTWMVENLNYIPPFGNSWCYDDNPFHCKFYGRLYDWQTAQSVSPTGWHVPSVDDWTVLINSLGGLGVASGSMKEASLVFWKPPNVGASNSSGFTALPGGNRITNPTPKFTDISTYAYFWSSTVSTIGQTAIYYYLVNEHAEIASNVSPQEYAFSIRCIRD